MILLLPLLLSPAHAACPRTPDVTVASTDDAATVIEGAISSTLDMGLPDLVVAVEGDHREEGYARIDADDDELSVTLCSASGAYVLLPPLFVTGPNLTLALKDVVIDETLTEYVDGLTEAFTGFSGCSLCVAEGASITTNGLTIGSEGTTPRSPGVGILLEDASLRGSFVAVTGRVGGAALEARAIDQSAAIELYDSTFTANSEGVFYLQGASRSSALLSAAVTDTTLSGNHALYGSGLFATGAVDVSFTSVDLLNDTSTGAAPVWVSGGDEGATLSWNSGAVTNPEGVDASFAVLEGLADPDGDRFFSWMDGLTFTLSSASDVPAIVVRDGSLVLRFSPVQWAPSWGTLVSVEDDAVAYMEYNDLLGEGREVRSPLLVANGGDFRLFYNRFCGIGDGVSPYSVVQQGGYRHVDLGAFMGFNLFQDIALAAPLFLGSTVDSESAAVFLFHNTFAGIQAPSITNGVFEALFAQNNLFSGLSNDGFSSTLGPSYGNNNPARTDTSDDGHNLWWDVTGSPYTSSTLRDALGPGSDLSVDPGFTGFDPTDCTSLPLLSGTSPARGAGVGGISGLYVDGSPLDLGATGGNSYWDPGDTGTEDTGTEDTGVETGRDTGDTSGPIPHTEDSSAPVGTDTTYWLGGTGCGCASAPALSGWLPVAVGLLLLSARRRTP